MKHLFYDDYSEGCHPEILDFIAAHNDGQERGYGQDQWCRLAAERIQGALGRAGAVHFVPGGTHANQIALASVLASYEGVIAPVSGHIAVHEAGSVEVTGHKVITVPSPDGKLRPSDLEAGLATHQDEHTVVPRVAYLSQSTELGSTYSSTEFNEVLAYAHRQELITYLDGARLSMALANPAAGMTLRDIGNSELDLLYLGGTKVGGMFGEAIVVLNEELDRNFRYHIKQRGGLLAKGRFLGLQFARFFTDDQLWLNLGATSNARAAGLAEGLQAIGFDLALPQETNQVFVWLPDELCRRMHDDYGFYDWARGDDGRTMIRLVCSWATPASAVERFLADAARGIK